ncbi:MAG: hypothetical protein V7708_17360 [Oceanicoccus sp.]
MDADYATKLLSDTGRVEVRAITDKAVKSYYLTDPDELIRRANQLSASGFNVYTTLNTFGRVEDCVSNTDIVTINRIFFDFDGSSAHCHRKEVMSYLSALGWPEPLRGNSGNGYHLLYRCKILPSDELTKQLRTIYTVLGERYESFDPVVYNSARLCRLYGTLNYNDKNGLGSGFVPPLSKCAVPAHWQTVKHRQIEELYELLKPEKVVVRKPSIKSGKATGVGDYSTLDIVSWLQSHNLYLKPSHIDGMHYVTCPRHHRHAKHSTSIAYDDSNGKPAFKCHNSKCHGYGLWELIAELGGADDYCREVYRV